MTGTTCSTRTTVAAALAIGIFTWGGLAVAAPKAGWRFDCGTADSPLMKGYERLTADEKYNPSRGYGWETASAVAVDFTKTFKFDWKDSGYYAVFRKESVTPLNADAVQSDGDLPFRADVPNGAYRVTVTIGDITKNLGSIDMTVNSHLVGEHLAAWNPGGHPGGGGRHRNSVMAIEIVPDKPAPVVGENDQLKLTRAIESSALKQAVEEFNAKKFSEALKSLIPNIEAPNDLEPRTTTIGFNWRPAKASHDIHVVLDPENRIKNEITTFNNMARRTLTEPVEKPGTVHMGSGA